MTTHLDAPLDPESARHVGGRSWVRKPDGTIHLGPLRQDATEDRPDHQLATVTGHPHVEAVEQYGPARGVVRNGRETVEQGPLGFRYRCGGCGVDHFNSTRYPLPRLVACVAGFYTVVEPPAESIDLHDWDRHGRLGATEGVHDA